MASETKDPETRQIIDEVTGHIIYDDRVMKDVVAPPIFPLSKEKVIGPDGSINIAVLKEHLAKEGRLSAELAQHLISRCSAQFKSEPNILELKYPVTVCGDVHGQFFDLLRLFEVGGDPKDTQYLFLGDYVDRGCFSSEVVFYLYALKLTYPKTFFMLRGNHECRQLTSFFNFKDECLYKYNLEMYDMIMESFDHLPLAAIVNKSFFCVHGGLSPDIGSLEDIRALDRHIEIPREGPMCDLLWSDPIPNGPEESTEESDDRESDTWFSYNETRQCSFYYGVDAVKRFLKDNKLTSIIRAHEAQLDGYKMQMINKGSGIPRVITIFSAPNYCDVYKNKAACLKFDNNVLNIKQFLDTAHPYYLPNFMDVFQWSLPFVAEKVTDMLANVLSYEDHGSDDDTTSGGSGDETKPKRPLHERGGMLKKKVIAVTRLLRVYKTLREQNEAIVQLKQLSPSHKVPFGLLRAGSGAIKKALTNFDSAKAADLPNERMPNGPGSPPVLRRTPSEIRRDAANLSVASATQPVPHVSVSSPSGTTKPQ